MRVDKKRGQNTRAGNNAHALQLKAGDGGRLDTKCIEADINAIWVQSAERVNKSLFSLFPVFIAAMAFEQSSYFDVLV